MNEQKKYNINTDIKYDYLQIIDLPDIVNNCKDKWFNQTLCKVNDSLLRLGILEGEFHWHKHEKEDELFFVLEGSLSIETEKDIFELEEKQGVCIPKGLMHRPVTCGKVIVLMIENNTIKPTGD